MSILVPIDVSAPSRAAVEVAISLARVRQEDLVLVHAHAGPEPANLERLADLHTLAEPVRAEGVLVRIRVVNGDPVSSVCAWGRNNEVSLIVTGTRGPQDLTVGSSSSTARSLSLCADVPVVAVRPGVGGLGPGTGPIHMVSPTHPASEEVCRVLGEAWGRSASNALPNGEDAPLRDTILDDESALTVVSIDGSQPWSPWCEEVLLRARGTTLVVSQGIGFIPSQKRTARQATIR